MYKPDVSKKYNFIKLSLRRHKIRQSRRIKKMRRIKQKYGYAQKRFGKNSKIIKLLSNSKVEPLKQSRKRETKIIVPETLSFIDDPEGTLKLICSFAKAAHLNPPRSLVFDHSRLKTYDIAASALLDIVASEINSYYKIRGSRYKMKSGGMLPACDEAKRFIRSIGIIKHLDVSHEAPGHEEARNIVSFDYRRKNYTKHTDPSNATVVDKTATRFVSHINECLETALNACLTDNGRGRLIEYVTEILNNAEEHAGFMDWTIQSYLDVSATIPYCEIGIFNFGQAISETLINTSKYTNQQIGLYVEKHKKHQLFSKDWHQEDLLTVIALQPNVSSKNRSKDDSRGQGTVDLIQFFQKVQHEISAKNHETKMAILSGSTHILFDGTYQLTENDSKLECIAFNKTNDLNERPDPKYVRSLKDLRFPGTLISIRFPLHRDMLIEGRKHG